MVAETLSEQILRENAAVFEAMVNHRFVDDIVLERLSAQVFERYLVYEGAFVETAISISLRLPMYFGSISTPLSNLPPMR